MSLSSLILASVEILLHRYQLKDPNFHSNQTVDNQKSNSNEGGKEGKRKSWIASNAASQHTTL